MLDFVIIKSTVENQRGEKRREWEKEREGLGKEERDFQADEDHEGMIHREPKKKKSSQQSNLRQQNNWWS